MTSPEDVHNLPTVEAPSGANEQTSEIVEVPQMPPADPAIKTAERQDEITRLTDSIEGTKSRINEIREGLGLPPTDDDPPSVQASLKRLQAEQIDSPVGGVIAENATTDEYDMDVPTAGTMSMKEMREHLKQQQLAREETEHLKKEQENAITPEERTALKAQVTNELQTLERNRPGLHISEEIKTPDILLADLDALTPQEGLSVNVPEDVVKDAFSIQEKLLEHLDSARLGPVYYITTSKGETLIVRDASFDTWGGQWGEVREERHVLIATDERGEVQALRGARMDDSEHVQGTVVALSRGRGAASAVDAALNHVLQRISDSRRRRVTWVGHNENQGVLEQMEKDGADSEALASKRAEQQRWQSLYGEGGRFGFALHRKAVEGYPYDVYTKEFEPLDVPSESEAELETPQGRIKSGFRSNFIVSKKPENIGEVYIQQGEDGMTAREVPLPQDDVFKQQREDILRAQLNTILGQMQNGKELRPAVMEVE